MSSVTQARFQLFSPLPEDKYLALKSDIQTNGVLVPVEIDQNGQTLDGHHRIRAWNELKEEGHTLPEYPRVIRVFDNDDDREEHAAKINCNRRDVSLDDKQRVALSWRQRGWSYRRISDALGVGVATAHRWIPEQESGVPSGTPEMPGRVIGKDGKSYGAIAPKPKPTVFATSEREQERALTALDALSSYEDDDSDVIAPVNLNTGEILTSAQIRQKAAQRQRQARNEELSQNSDKPLPSGKFRCIVIDPPWPMAKINRDERPDQGISLDYPVMSLEDIAAMPVGDLAEDDGCHIYLWVTQRFLPDGIQMLKGWGFNYQCVMTWVKPTGITPYSWMYNTEHVLFGRKGSLDLMRMGLKLSFEAPVTRHSEKPDSFYERVVSATPGPRLEMFSRANREGFVAWGNEVIDDIA